MRSTSSRSDGVITPRSPWQASAGCTKNAGVRWMPTLAASFVPICPLLPMPLTITCPVVARIKRQGVFRTPLPFHRSATRHAERPADARRIVRMAGDRSNSTSSWEDEMASSHGGGCAHAGFGDDVWMDSTGAPGTANCAIESPVGTPKNGTRDMAGVPDASHCQDSETACEGKKTTDNLIGAEMLSRDLTSTVRAHTIEQLSQGQEHRMIEKPTIAADRRTPRWMAWGRRLCPRDRLDPSNS